MVVTPRQPLPIHRLDGIQQNFKSIEQSGFYRFKTVFCLIEDLNAATTAHDARVKDAWMAASDDILKSWFTRFKKAFPKHAFGPTKEAKPHYWEWALVAHFEEGATELHLITFAQYKDALLSGSGSTWETLCKSDAVLGGICLESDFITPKGTVIFNNPGAHQGLAVEEVKPFIKHLMTLSACTILVPSPPQMITRGSKLTIASMLRHSARHVTKSIYPEIRGVVDPLDLSLQRNGVVVKRSFSDSACHVLMGGDPDFGWKMEEMGAEQDSFYNLPVLQKIGIAPKWFAMTYIQEMKTKGEIRMYFIGGALAYMMWTQPGSDEMRSGL
ncbi:hypothetical protein APHAL10511_008573 [Amanita phalloides]|nr:hypothetical protein APHAL10511_008573 [Amanita phalloides]